MDASTGISIVTAIIGVGCTLAGSVLGWLVFWLRFAAEVARAHATAEAAEKEAAEVKVLCEQNRTSIIALAAEFGLYREHVAREYVSKETMRELKTDLMSAIKDVAEKLDRVLAHQ